MKDKLRAAFDQVRMDPECAGRIENALNQTKPAGGYTAMPFRENRRSRLTAAAAMACLLAVVLFAGTVLFGGETKNGLTAQTDPVPDTETVQVTIAYENKKTELEAALRIHGHKGADFLRPEGDRLYFTADGQYTDITDLISDDEPYTYIYTDNAGIVHCLAVGGCYTPGSNSLDGVYYGYWYRDAADADERFSGWISGACAGHWCNATNDYFGWYVKACEILDIPWKPQ